MKSYIYIFILLLFASCTKEYLEVKPKGNLIADKLEDYNNLLEDNTFVYLSTDAFFLNAQHILGDDVAALEPHYNNAAYFGTAGTRNQKLFEWQNDVYLPNEDMYEVEGMYRRIYTANKIIDEIPNAKGNNELLKSQYQSEAKAQRAFAYFILVNYFGKPYAAATAQTELGVPLILKNDFDRKDFTRASIQQVYDQIIKDLNEAIPNLPSLQTTANRFTKAAAEALLGKVYIFMARPADALPQLKNAIEHLPTTFSTGGVFSWVNYNTATLSNAPAGYVFINANVKSVASQGNGYPETLNAQLVPGVMWMGRAAPLIIAPETYALYQPGDLRIQLFSNTYAVTAPGPAPTLPAGLYRSRAGFFGNSIGIQLPDIYLLSAEAKARTNDLNGAREDLLTLRNNRMPANLAAAGIPTDQTLMIKFVINERQREFATMGFRWFDMRRLSVDPLFNQSFDYKHEVYTSSGTIKNTYKLRYERLEMKFSEKLMLSSPGLINNP